MAAMAARAGGMARSASAAAARRIELDADADLARLVLRRRPASVRLSRAVSEAGDGLEDGDLIHVHARGRYVGAGIHEVHPREPAARPGTVHMIHYAALHGDVPLADLRVWWAARMQEALQYRGALGLRPGGRTMCRLVHGSADGFPFLGVDLYGQEAAVLRVRKPFLRRYLADIVAAMPQALDVERIYARYDYNGAPAPEYFRGDSPGDAEHVFEEGDMRFAVDWERSQKTGFYLDQRDSRRTVRALAAGRDVLDLCSYTGGFSVAALHGGARSITAVDASQTYLAMCQRNMRLNADLLGASAGRVPHTAHASDALEYLRSLPAGAFDMMVVDPPALAESRASLEQARSFYRRLNTLALRKLRPGGILVTFSCTHAVSTADFFDTVRHAAHAARVDTRRIAVLGQPADHPVASEGDSTEYLKGLALHVARVSL